jgi:hypothetical protein
MSTQGDLTASKAFLTHLSLVDHLEEAVDWQQDRDKSPSPRQLLSSALMDFAR